MSEPPNIKPAARQLVESLPETATWDDLAYEVYVRQAIERRGWPTPRQGGW